MRLARYFVFILCFFLDVHVRAAEGDCAIGGAAVKGASRCVLSGRIEYKQKELILVLDEGGLAQRSPDGEWRLVRGLLYVESEKSVRLNTPYARVSCAGTCRGIFERKQSALSLVSLAGEWRVARTGDEAVYLLPVATQVSVAEVGELGVAEMEFPQSLPWLSTARAWARLFPGDAEEFKRRLAAFRGPWRKAVQAASDLDQTVANRAIASFNQTQAEEQARKMAQEREDQKLRQMFREKNYFAPHVP